MTVVKCKENIDFKEVFINCIDNIESRTYYKKNHDSIYVNLKLFNESLDIISMYVPVNYSYLANYSYGYANYDIFNEEKNKWMQWYEGNKCNNIRIKKIRHKLIKIRSDFKNNQSLRNEID